MRRVRSLLELIEYRGEIDHMKGIVAESKATPKVQQSKPPGLPENTLLMVTAIYDLVRTQRNDLGHSRDMPPIVKREDAFVNLQIFPRYYQTAEELRTFLASNSI